MKIINWQPLLTEHQYHTWMSLQALGDEIYFVLGNLENDIRKQQGWTNVNLSNLDAKVLSPKNWWNDGKTIIQQNPEAIHVFVGFWTDRRFFPLLLYAAWHGIKLVIMHEAYSEYSAGYVSEEFRIISWIKVQLRPLLYRMAAMVLQDISRGNQLCILTIGSRTIGQLTRAGFEREQLFPFGYFVPKQEGIESTPASSAPLLRLIFVGALLKRKGLDIALEAVGAINKQGKEADIILDIYGPGHPDNWILPSSAGVTYKGVIPFGGAQSVIAQYDFLILPSRHDGWGVVVNEALLQGIPVIVSDQVGAKSLVNATGAGVVFKSGDVADLEQVLRDLETNQTLRSSLRDCAANVACKIFPEVAAKYMKDVFNFFFYNQGERPNEIWSM